MKTWQALYGMIWLCFATLFVAVFDPIPHKDVAHGVLGLAVLALAFRNKSVLSRTDCPARVKRIAAATANICVLALITGAVMAVPQVKEREWILYILKALHIFAIGAIVTQTASVATAHDVWEQGECGNPRPDEKAPGA